MDSLSVAKAATTTGTEITKKYGTNDRPVINISAESFSTSPVLSSDVITTANLIDMPSSANPNAEIPALPFDMP